MTHSAPRLPFWLALLAAASISRIALAQAPVGELFASDATVRGSVILAGAGTQVLSGSSVAAGQVPASFRLSRGGEVRICPGTRVTISSSQSGRDLMLGMSNGAIEAHYSLPASSDSILTPDFRILLAGPGKFDFAFSADVRGNTCVRALEGNTASVIVSELMGDGVYQVKSDQQLLFSPGHFNQPQPVASQVCGCAKAAPVLPAQLKAEAPRLPPQRPKAAVAQKKEQRPAPAPPPISLLSIPASAAPPLQALPLPAPASTGEVHVQVDAPFVFRAVAPVPPELTYAVARLHLGPLSQQPLLLQASVLPPSTLAAPGSSLSGGQKKGFFRRLGSFFGAILRPEGRY